VVRDVLRSSVLALVVGLALVPRLAYAQASVAGVVKDASGAVLPGVTVEAASPALIEKVRSAVTDGSGQYKVEQLRPGSYTVTFTLTGFSTLKREGIVVTGSATTSVNAELKVGALTETVTVTGAASTVDVQGITEEKVLGRDILDALPFGRTPQTAALLLPGFSPTTTFGPYDVGGTGIIMTGGGLTVVHGSLGGDSRILLDGLSTSGSEGSGAFTNMLVNFGLAQEITVDYANAKAEQGLGGVQTNIIARDGGNAFAGGFFGTFVNSSFQGSNYSSDLKDRGLATPNTIKMTYDVNPELGGPIQQDRLWFYTSDRWVRNENYVGGIFYNQNAGNPAAWTYVPDTTRPAYIDSKQPSLNLRMTWQATPRNKFTVFYDYQTRCQCPDPSATISPEATSPGVGPIRYSPLDMWELGWASPVSNRLLLELRTSFRREDYTFDSTQDPFVNLINVTEQGGLIPGLSYRGGGIGSAGQPYLNTVGANWNTIGSASFITGSHAFKVGFNNLWVKRDNIWAPRMGEPQEVGADYLAYRFDNGVPNQITERATPYGREVRQPWDLGVYLQDTWTLNRMTVNAGVRFSYYSSYAPATSLGPAPLTPTRDVAFPETQMLDFKDLVPRLGATYDLFGTKKTALKVGLSKYVQALGTQVGFMNGALDPVSSLALFVTRSWNPPGTPATNPNYYVPQCDLTNPFANGNCGTVSDTHFGSPDPSTTSAPETTTGWGRRPYQWEFSTSIQQELAPRVSVDIGYYRRSFGNLIITDNLALAPSDFAPFFVTAPLDPRLPGGGGYSLGPFYNENPNAIVRPNNNVIKLASDYGSQIQIWSGVDLTLNARLADGLTAQGGVSTGHTLTDDCQILAQVPEAGLFSAPFCRVLTPYLPELKLQTAYVIPKVDVQLAGSFRSSPGPALSANEVIPNAAVVPSLGRSLSGGASNVTVPLIAPGSLYGDRANEVDLRIGKVVRIGHVRNVFSLDVFNVLNANPALTEGTTYVNTTLTGWRVPTSTLPARFAKISAQINF
jgi:hypothetical protein